MLTRELINARCHQFGIQLDWVIPQLCCCDRLQALTTLRKVRVALDPSETVHVDTAPTLELIFRIYCESSLEEHVDTIGLRSRAEKRKIEEITVKRGHNRRLHVLDVLEELRDCCSLTESTPVNKCGSS